MRVGRREFSFRETIRDDHKNNISSTYGGSTALHSWTYLKAESLYLSVPGGQGIFCFEMDDALQLVDVAAHALLRDHLRRDSLRLRSGNFEQSVHEKG